MPERPRPAQLSKQEHSLFSVMGEKLAGRAMALVIVTSEADADYFALHELGFVSLSVTILVSDSVYVGPADTWSSQDRVHPKQNLAGVVFRLI